MTSKMAYDLCCRLVRQVIQDIYAITPQLVLITEHNELGRTEDAAIAYLNSASAKMAVAEALFQSIHTLQGDRRAEGVFEAFRLFESKLLRAYASKPSPDRQPYRQAFLCLDQLVMTYQDSVFYPQDR